TWVARADGIGGRYDTDDLVLSTGVGEIVQTGDGGDGKRRGACGIAGAAAGAADSPIVETNDGGGDAGQCGGDMDRAVVAAMHVRSRGDICFFCRSAGTIFG